MNETNHELDFRRIKYLLNPDSLKDKLVTIVGLGSGGAPVCDHLVMNGVRRWKLYDPDILDAVNLVKHPRMRKDLNRAKVEIQKEWILDRNPLASVETFQENVLDSKSFQDSVKRSDLILCCPDKRSVREYVNDICVLHQIPCITASVFRTGVGGEVFGYFPGDTGCYKCLQLFSIDKGINLSDDALALTQEEEERIYGLGEKDFQASGLSLDIQFIALIQARMALSFLLRGSSPKLPPLKSNWIIFGNRPSKNMFRSHFEVEQMRMRPQKLCNCTTIEHGEEK